MQGRRWSLTPEPMLLTTGLYHLADEDAEFKYGIDHTRLRSVLYFSGLLEDSPLLQLQQESIIQPPQREVDRITLAGLPLVPHSELG